MIPGSRRSFSLQTPFALKPLKHWVIAPLVMEHKTWLPGSNSIVAIAMRAAENRLEEETVNNISSCTSLLLSAHASKHKLLVYILMDVEK